LLRAVDWPSGRARKTHDIATSDTTIGVGLSRRLDASFSATFEITSGRLFGRTTQEAGESFVCCQAGEDWVCNVGAEAVAVALVTAATSSEVGGFEAWRDVEADLKQRFRTFFDPPWAIRSIPLPNLMA
jgi:hypothetical protein